MLFDLQLIHLLDFFDVKIADFNVSKFDRDHRQKKYSSLTTDNYRMWTNTGTYLYNAPEIIVDQDYTYTNHT